MIFSQNKEVGSVALSPAGPFQTGERVTLTITFTVGAAGLNEGARLRIGLPNTGWEKPVVPQLRYWDELVFGKARGYAPFHPTNTTATLKTASKAVVALESMERMLLPNEDPAEAYWRWWITAKLEDAPLAAGDQIVLTYGDLRFVGEPARIQTFPESDLTISAYLDVCDGKWVRPDHAPIKIDVIPGPEARANVVVPSIIGNTVPELRIGLTDASHCRPSEITQRKFLLRDEKSQGLGSACVTENFETKIHLAKPLTACSRISVVDVSDGKVWGKSNPSIPQNGNDLKLFWGDLHAQSEYHVMHSQKKDARQSEWAKGISCGKPDDVYQYARDVSLLDFVAITDQGAITGVGWEILKQKATEYNRPGKFVTFNSYEAGSPVGHRNVFYRNGEACPPQEAAKFNYMPEFLYRYYGGRKDVMLLPPHGNTWTDWSFYDPELEPVMEIYSCWGQSENPSRERWDKGMTPGAGAWEALKRGYRLGMIASSDNHVGMPGRSYPHDRQVHTPFPGGLAAVWAPELKRETIFDAVKARRCYGTTGARIILEFSVNEEPMGGEIVVEDKEASRKIRVKAHGSDAISKVEILRNGNVVHTSSSDPRKADDKMLLEWDDNTALEGPTFYYVRLTQADGEMAWSSPVWADILARS